MKIKVCGLTRFDQMQQLKALGIDYAGLIFYEGSKRYAGSTSEEEKEKIRGLEVKKIGVFVNADFETIEKFIDDFGLFAVQLHGDETDEFCLELMDKVKVIKVIRMGAQTELSEMVEQFEVVCHYFLFDTDAAGYGGSGKGFNWELLQSAGITKPFFLSGGIGPEDADKINAFKHPHLYAVDVNSRFETGPGLKDIDKVAQFINALNNEQGKPSAKV